MWLVPFSFYLLSTLGSNTLVKITIANFLVVAKKDSNSDFDKILNIGLDNVGGSSRLQYSFLSLG